MVTLITLFVAATKQHYVTLKNGEISEETKISIANKMNAVLGAVDNTEATTNIVYFQELEIDDRFTFFNINGDKQAYDLIEKFIRKPEYII